MPIHIICNINLLFCENSKFKLQYVIKSVGLFVQVDKTILMQNTAAVSSWVWFCMCVFSYRLSKIYCLAFEFLFPGLNLKLVLVNILFVLY